jgi:uncharacterized protein YjbI with pentapeptide repeats
MSECRHYEICGLPMMDSLAGLCILHSRLKDKDVREFDKALKEHRETRGDQFAHMVFPEKWLSRLFETFAAKTSFRNATFSARADFSRVSFSAGADFLGATFSAGADFSLATFSAEANFLGATFSAGPNFSGAAFSAGAEFLGATFSAGANFQVRLFSGGNITFKQCRFSGRTLFAQLPEAGAQQIPRIFTGATTVNFSDIAIEPPESLSFRHADFRICRFLNTDLRKVELTGALWPQKGTRWVVYDEMAPVPHEPYPWEQLERLYRELKQNYDDRRNYPRVGDFHYGEKEIQRRNPATPLSLKVFLWLYWLVSGYGERFLRPLLWAVGFWALATVGYLLSSLSPAKEAAVPALAIADPATWGHAVLYSLQVMLFFRPPDFVLSTVLAKTMYTLQSLLGPLVLGLFALAVRQRLRH